MTIDGHDSEDVGVTTDFPQGSLVSPILFVTYVSGVHHHVESRSQVASISFVDDITWIASG